MTAAVSAHTQVTLTDSEEKVERFTSIELDSSTFSGFLYKP